MASTPPIPPHQPSDDAKELYAKHVAQAWIDQQASSDAFDNNLLVYSSAALGISIAFIKDIVPLEHAEWLRTLYLSWFSFAGCMIVTIASFQFSVQAQRAHTGFLSDYYLEGDDTWSARLEMCQWIRETLDKESVWDEERSINLSRL